jgi:hypothetical protein
LLASRSEYVSDTAQRGSSANQRASAHTIAPRANNAPSIASASAQADRRVFFGEGLWPTTTMVLEGVVVGVEVVGVLPVVVVAGVVVLAGAVLVGATVPGWEPAGVVLEGVVVEGVPFTRAEAGIENFGAAGFVRVAAPVAEATAGTHPASTTDTHAKHASSPANERTPALEAQVAVGVVLTTPMLTVAWNHRRRSARRPARPPRTPDPARQRHHARHARAARHPNPHRHNDLHALCVQTPGKGIRSSIAPSAAASTRSGGCSASIL